MLAAALIFIAYTYRYEIASQGIGVLVADKLAQLTKTSVYPVTLPDEPSELLAVGQRPALIAGGTMYMYNPVGEKKAEDRIGGQSTLAASTGNYLLVYTRGGYDVHVFSGDTELYRLHLDNAIHAACIARSGYIAVATAENAASAVTVYDRSGREEFRWLSPGCVVTALALDAKGARVAVGGVSSEDGTLRSEIHAFSLSASRETISETLADELLLELKWRSDGDLAAVTDRAGYALDGKKTLRAEFDAQPTAYAIFDDGAVAAAAGDYLSAHEVRLLRYSPAMKETETFLLDQNVLRLLPVGSDLMIFTGERVLRVTETFEHTALYETTGALQVVPAGKTLYYTTVSHLEQVPMH